MSGAAAPPPLPALDGTLGALLIGAFVSCLFLGITTVQIYFYLGRFPNDSIFNKSIACSVWVIDVIQTAFQCHAMYFYLVTNYANPVVLAAGVWTLDSMSLLEAFVGGPVEIFFAVRVLKLSGGTWAGKILTGLIVILTIVHSTLGIAFSIKTYQNPLFSFWQTLDWDTITGLTCAAAADVLIALGMIYYLRSRKTVFAQSRNLINQLMLYSAETGLLTSICAVVIIICFVAMPSNFVALGLLLILPKLYANSMLAMLNARESLRPNGENSTSQSVSVRSINYSGAGGPAYAGHAQKPSGAIQLPGHAKQMSNQWKPSPVQVYVQRDEEHDMSDMRPGMTAYGSQQSDYSHPYRYDSYDQKSSNVV